MKLSLKSSGSVVVAMLAIVAIGIAFWLLVLGPKRDEAAKLGHQVEQLEASLTRHRAEIAEGEAAKREFSADYQKLVVLGKAVPGDDDTASLLVQVNQIAARNQIRFKTIKLNSAGGGGEEGAAPAATPSGSAQPVSATEAAASLLPLGARIGPAGLAVMPYTLTFEGNFFKLADFIEELDQLVKTSNENVRVDGRLITLDGFALAPDKTRGFPALEGSFAVTTYLTPPNQGVTGGASPQSPGSALATPASATTGAGG